MPWPASTLVGPPDLEPGEALARIPGFLQVDRTPEPSPASGRNPPQADSGKSSGKQTIIINSMQYMKARYSGTHAARHMTRLQESYPSHLTS